MSLLLYFDDEQGPAQGLAGDLGWPCGPIQCHSFPDGEYKLTLPTALPQRVVLYRGLQQPNAKLAQLMLVAPALRESGVRHLTLVAPYLAYMRQDKAFVPGEVVSQRHLGRALAQWFDAVITVDPHLHRVHSMEEVVPGRAGLALTAAGLIGAFVAREVPGALLLGPDEESGQWVRAAAAAQALDHGVCLKTRRGDHEVEVRMPAVKVSGRRVVVLDDVASTGRTLVAATRLALAQGALSVDVAVTHGLFVGDALTHIRDAGARHVWSTDSVAHSSNVIPLAPLLARSLAELHRDDQAL